MKFFAAAALALSALVAAQDISDIPQCALPCLLNNIPATGCSPTDYNCVCMQSNINKINAPVTSCVTSSCNNVTADLQTLNALNGICAMHGGGQIPNPLGGGSTTSSSSSITPGPRATYFTAGAPAAAAATGAAGMALAGALAALAL